MRYEVVNHLQRVVSVTQSKKDGTDDQKGQKLIIRGTAVSHNDFQPNLNGFIYPEKVLQKYASSLKGHPLVMDHLDSVEKVVGKVINSWYDSEKKAIMYEADINVNHPSGVATTLQRGDVDSVSIKAYSDNVVCNICGSNFKECDHLLLEQYEGTICGGVVNNLYFKHLSLVTDPADLNASDMNVIAASIQKENERRMVELIQKINDYKKDNILNKRKNNGDSMTEKEKLSQEELEKIQQSILNTIKKETEVELKQKEAEISALSKKLEEAQKYIEAIEQEKKEKLINEICDISGEEPSTYENMTIASLEKIKQSVIKLREKIGINTEEIRQENNTDEGVFTTTQPQTINPKTKVDEREEIVQFFAHLFNLRHRNRPLPKPIKTAITDISQREVIGTGKMVEVR